MQAQKTLLYATLMALLLASIVIVLGAYTRLSHAGLGCPDWPTCYGHIWVPKTSSEVATANQLFQGTPVEHDKTWPEQLHRIFASALGLLILLVFFLSFRARDPQHPWQSIVLLLGALISGTVCRVIFGAMVDPLLWVAAVAYFLNLSRLIIFQEGSRAPFKLPAFIVGLVIVQGLFGMWTVTLSLWPLVVTLHLLGGFATFGLLFLLVQRLSRWRWTAEAIYVVAFMRLRPLAILVLVLLILQIALGGWLSSNYAALACPDFPLCQNQLWPEASFGRGFNFLQHIGPNYLGGLLDDKARTAIHLSHRLGALLVFVASSVLIARLWLSGFIPARNHAYLLSFLVLMQVCLGVLNVVLSLPLGIAVAHNAVGALLLITVIMINHRLRTVATK